MHKYSQKHCLQWPNGRSNLVCPNTFMDNQTLVYIHNDIVFIDPIRKSKSVAFLYDMNELPKH